MSNLSLSHPPRVSKRKRPRFRRRNGTERRADERWTTCVCVVTVGVYAESQCHNIKVYSEIWASVRWTFTNNRTSRGCVCIIRKIHDIGASRCSEDHVEELAEGEADDRSRMSLGSQRHGWHDSIDSAADQWSTRTNAALHTNTQHTRGRKTTETPRHWDEYA